MVKRRRGLDPSRRRRTNRFGRVQGKGDTVEFINHCCGAAARDFVNVEVRKHSQLIIKVERCQTIGIRNAFDYFRRPPEPERAKKIDCRARVDPMIATLLPQVPLPTKTGQPFSLFFGGFT
jgi:hypothetical protein